MSLRMQMMQVTYYKNDWQCRQKNTVGQVAYMNITFKMYLDVSSTMSEIEYNIYITHIRVQCNCYMAA